MADDPLRNRLAAFLPRMLWGQLDGDGEGSRTEGCALFADVAGFTPLTESLAKIGKEGAEELTRILNDFFSAMVGIVHQEGGDVLRFGGDAMTVFFPAGLSASLRAASRMQQEARRFGAIETRGGTFALGMKIGIADGALLLGTVGDTEVGRDYFAAGRCLDRSADGEHHATRGQIALCPACARQLPPRAAGVTVLADGFALIADPAAAGTSLERSPESGPDPKRGTFRWPPLPDAAVLEAFLPPFISDKARASQGLLQAEHRRTTVLFLSFSGLDYEEDPEVVEKVRALYHQIARVSSQHGGWVNKLDMGDKGSKAIVLFGAPQALEHQEERACRAALALLADPALRSSLTDLRIGITASPLFAAYVGSGERREYTVMGDGINMAARLMANAHPWRVLASREVMEQAGKALAFRELDPIFVKGKAEKVAIFRPEGEREDAVEEQGRFVGREALLDETLPGLLDPSAPAFLALSGDAGAGKSALLHRMGRALSEAGMRRITVPLVAHSVHSYLAAWRPVLFASLGVTRTAPAHIREGALRLAAAGEDEAYLPLFGPLLGLDLPETEASGALGAKERKDVLFAMLVRLFLRQAEGGPYGIFLDHLEYADPASLELLQALVSEAGDRPLKLAVAVRSKAAEGLGEVLGGFKALAVLPFTEAEARDYCILVGGMTPPTDTFIEFLQHKTGGNPKFLEQILGAMEKAGLLAPGPSGLLEVDEDRLASTAFPDTLEGLLLSRVDGLPEDERGLLKAASVLGPSFSLNLLQTLTEIPQNAIVNAIRSLEEKGIVRMDTWGARPYATFADALLRDALYESLNFTVKRAFHARVAGLLEQQGAGDPRLWPPLARHFEAAGEDRKACHYLWSAAEDARARYDNTSAFDFLGRYVALCEKAGADPAEDVQFRKGLLYLAEASKELGRLDETDIFCQRILEAITHPCAESVTALSKLADNKRRRGDLQGALDVYEKAAGMAEFLDDKVQQMHIVSDSGVPLAMMGLWNEAMASFQRAEDLARKLKVYPSLVYAIMNQGMCYQYGRRDYRGAFKAFRKAHKAAVRHQLRPHLVTVLVNKAQVLFEMGQYQKALQSIQEGLLIAKQFGYRQPYLGMISNKALQQCMLGCWEEARESAESALTLASHYEMVVARGINRQTLGMLAGQAGDLEGCIAFRSTFMQDPAEINNCDSMRAALCEILVATNQWQIPDLARPYLEEHGALLEGLGGHDGNVHTLALRAQFVIHGTLCGTIPTRLAENELRDCLQFAVRQGTLWLQAEIREALITVLTLQERAEEACDAGEELLRTLGRYYCPLKVPPFLLALASAQERAGRWESLKPVIRRLRRYEKTLDRGLTGMRYHALLSRAALRARRKKEAKARRERAVQIAQTVLALQRSQIYRAAFLALPGVRDLLGPVE